MPLHPFSWSRCVSLHWVVVGIVVPLAALVSTSAIATAGLVWSDEIEIDPGTRAPSMYFGFSNRIELQFDREQDRIYATWSEAHSASGTQVYEADLSGRALSSVRWVGSDEEFSPIQVFPGAEGEWVALELGVEAGLRISRYQSLRNEPVESILLEPFWSGEVDARSPRMERASDGWWLAWRSASGTVRMARITSEFRLDGQIADLAESTRSMDVEFGEEGGVIGWLNQTGWFYITLDTDGGLVHEPRFVEEFAASEASNLFRIAERVFFVQAAEEGRYRLRGYDRHGTPVVERTLLGHRDSSFDVVSGPGGALVVGRSWEVWGLLLGDDAAPVGTAITLQDWLEDDRRSRDNIVAATSTGVGYLVAWSVRQEPVGISGDECHPLNYLGFRTWGQSGELSETGILNATYEPRQSQPWFVGEELHLVMRDGYSNRVQHVLLDDVGAPRLLGEIGRLRPCKARLDVSIAHQSGQTLYFGRLETTLGDFEDEDSSTFWISRLEGNEPAVDMHAPGGTGPGGHWSITEVDGELWVATDYRHFDERFTTIHRVGSDYRLEVQPTPSQVSTQLIELDARPFVLWQHTQTLFGGFVPESDEQPIEPTALCQVAGLGLECATEGGSGGLIVFRSNGELFVLTLSAGGTTLGPPRALGHGYGAHAAWNGARYLVSWLDGQSAEWAVKVARVTEFGAVLDFGGETIGATNLYVPPLVAAASPERGAITYGGARLRRISDTTRLDAKGPFIRTLPPGIEISWEVGDARVTRVSVERARLEREGDAGPFVVVQGQSESAVSPFLDENLEPGALYSYRLRVLEETGSETLLGPVTAEWAGSESVTTMAFTIRPNPSSGSIAFVLSPGAPAPDLLSIVDAQGRVRVRISGEELPSLHEGEADLSRWCARLPSGTYWIRASRGPETVTRALSLIR